MQCLTIQKNPFYVNVIKNCLHNIVTVQSTTRKDRYPVCRNISCFLEVEFEDKKLQYKSELCLIL